MIRLNRDIIDRALRASKGNSAVLLCSSGVDSIAMTHYMLTYKRELFEDVLPLHFNHNIREENHKMERSFCKFMERCFPDALYSLIRNTLGGHTEDDFRKFRVSHLKHFTGSVVVSAHHLNDFVESYLINTIRGTPEYLPMPFFTTYTNEQVVTCKPFCFTRKQDFIDYAQQHDLMKYVVEDSTNRESKGSRRNMIRNEIIPILERDHVGIETVVAKRMRKRLALELLKETL